MHDAYKLAATAVRARLDKRGSIQSLSEVRAPHVIVLQGEHDHVQYILDLLEVKYRLDPRCDDFGEARVLFANCTNRRRTHYQTFLRRFCHEGGWLVSTDWCLHSLIEPCFRDLVRRKWGQQTGDEVVGIEAARESMWADVVVPGCEPQWWLEASSYPIEVLDSDRVRVEAASHEMLVRYDAPAVAVSFDWGHGRVHHLLSHFWMKRSRDSASVKHQETCEVFLREGMDFSEQEIAGLLRTAKLEASDVSFAQLQTAVTSTELVTQAVLGAMQSQPLPLTVGTGGVGIQQGLRWVIDTLGNTLRW